MLPAVGARSPDSMLIKVVFPAPLGPITACTVPLLRSSETLLTAVRPPNTLVSPRALRPRTIIRHFEPAAVGRSDQKGWPNRWGAKERSTRLTLPFPVANVLQGSRAAPGSPIAPEAARTRTRREWPRTAVRLPRVS